MKKTLIKKQILLFLVLLVLAPGCATLGSIFGRSGSDIQPPPDILLPDLSKAEVVSKVNSNYVSIQSFCDMRAKMVYYDENSALPFGNSIALQITLEKDDKMRLLGKHAAAGKVIDVGSDGEKFWFQMRNSPLYFCRFKDYPFSPEAQKLLHGIPPSQLLDLTALREIDVPLKNIEMRPLNDGCYQLIFPIKTVAGNFRKVLYVNNAALVFQVELRRMDQSGPVIKNVMSDFRKSEAMGIWFPRKHTIYVDGKERMKITLSDALALNASNPPGAMPQSDNIVDLGSSVAPNKL